MLAVGHMREGMPLGALCARARVVLALGNAPRVAFRACGIPSGVRRVANGTLEAGLLSFSVKVKGWGHKSLK